MDKAKMAIAGILSLFITAILRIPLGETITQIFQTDTSSWNPLAAILWNLMPLVIMFVPLFIGISLILSALDSI